MLELSKQKEEFFLRNFHARIILYFKSIRRKYFKRHNIKSPSSMLGESHSEQIIKLGE